MAREQSQQSIGAEDRTIVNDGIDSQRHLELFAQAARKRPRISRLWPVDISICNQRVEERTSELVPAHNV